ncbi:hypothetical protein [Mucilaginibacter sp. CSA2-8R]|uniref:hypothetical protein n=1 Tax=Mucilaginibacter sp. CSA2-8R TaxID=3141542 RepID=UPI00315C798F
MPKLYFVLLIFFVTGWQAHAQQGNYSLLNRGIHPGTVTLTDGQLLKGFVMFKDREANQKECIFYTDYNDPSSQKVFQPKELNGYTIENDQYKSIPYSGNIGFGKPSRSFVFTVKPGTIGSYAYWSGIGNEQLLWQKGNDEPISNSSMFFSFKKNMLKLIGDNPEMAAKVDRKEKGYTMMNTAQIIDEYNTWAESKK